MGNRSAKATASAPQQAAGWKPDALCDGEKAADRAKWVMQNCTGYSEIAAQQRVMREFPASFLAEGQWSPDVDCGGLSAGARAKWLVEQEHLSETAARQRVMTEFPSAFNGSVRLAVAAAEVPQVSQPEAAQASGRWNPDADCDGHRAADRAAWVVNNSGASEAQSQQLIMEQFPQQFNSGASQEPLAGWDPNVQCGDATAAARAQWLVENKQLSPTEAQRLVMTEFPQHFGGARVEHAAASSLPSDHWDEYVWCGDALSGARVKWLVENKAMSIGEAQRQIMSEFRREFEALIPEEEAQTLWNAAIDCDGISAERRMKWHIDKRGVTEAMAKLTVVREFPASFKAMCPSQPRGPLVNLLQGLGGGAPVTLPQQASPLSSPSDDLVWSDEFDYTGPPDPSKWDCDSGGSGWGNNELQYYTDRQAWETQDEQKRNAWVSNGMLRIVARRESCGNRHFTSARLVSRGHGEWTYGRFEARLRLPIARGSWPAFWLFPKVESYGEWPKSGEIDIMEHVGHDRGVVHGTVHTEAFNHLKSTQVGKSVTADVADWHTFAVTWTPTRIEWYIDGAKYHAFEKATDGGTDKWPFDHSFFIILNVAVGGSWAGQKGVDEAAFDLEEQSMDVAWVRVYQVRGEQCAVDLA
mmetsp:Transcript_26619/g.61184  ORF Transcript_26619/g.61184 Transcript_26619/m.61184 type:complete len:640 (+) Transcript_26619:41-1960(+)